MTRIFFDLDAVPVVLYGERADTVWLFVHGKCGCKEEAEGFAEIVCPKGAQVLSADLPGHGGRIGTQDFDPWRAAPELRSALAYLRRHWRKVCLRTNGVGAWLSMLAVGDTPVERALFVSPILDMEKFLVDRMSLEGVDEARLSREGRIVTKSGETFIWRCLQYARENPVLWAVPTAILYGGQDTLAGRSGVDAFAARFGCELTVVPDGEHRFHTPWQLAALRNWEESHT